MEEWSDLVQNLYSGPLTAYEVLQSIGHDLGVRIVDRAEFRDDNDEIIQYKDGVMFAPDVRLAAHEIGHFILAPIERRFQENYGLGGDPEFFGSSVPFEIGSMTDKERQQEEFFADYIGGMLVLQLGSVLEFENYIGMHNWGDREETEPCMVPLVEQGYLDGGYVPVVLLEWLARHRECI